MNKYLPKKATDIKGPVAIAELRRAHYIIAMLAVSFAGMIALGTAYELQFSAPLGIIAVILLLAVTAVSLGTAIVLKRR